MNSTQNESQPQSQAPLTTQQPISTADGKPLQQQLAQRSQHRPILAIVALVFSIIGLGLTLTTLKGGVIVIIGFVCGAIAYKRKQGGESIAKIAMLVAVVALVVAIVMIALGRG